MIEYEGYGNCIIAYTPRFNRTAKGKDEETGLYYLNARFYDPSNGRFLNPDSYRGEAADPQTLHLYAYCANNPITRIDPTGHAAETVIDVMFLGMSINDFRKEQSLTNFAFVVWDGVATIMPLVPGSYAIKGAKILSKADIVDNLGKQGIKIGSASEKAVKVSKKTVKTKTVKAGTGVYKKNLKNIKPLKGWNTMEDLIKKLPNVTSEKGISTVYKSSGGYSKALSDFNSLNLKNIKSISTQYGWGKMGFQSDGTKVIVRPGSSDELPTLEFQISKRNFIKIRY